ncbi:MAG TPA: pseudouridine synthase, partial [Puia sp.]|nr:pseudouridine synthase [Puia sp.]
MKKHSSGGERPTLGKRKTDNFSKFYNKKRNSAVKEELRQEKKAAKKEREEAIRKHFEDRRQSRAVPNPPLAAATPSRAVPNPPLAAANPSRAVPAPPRTRTNPSPARPAPPTGETMPLNKFIAHGGICSRRDAAELVRQGKVTVNGQLVTEPGTKVHPSDTIKVGGKKITISHNLVYILLNKPKDYITTTDDPQGRRTVVDLIRNATTERVFPVGRLDRNTSGVLLFTNDGDLAQKLAHPSHQIRKIYHVTLDKPLNKADFDKIAAGGITLEDGPAPVDDLAYADPKDRTQIGIEIHSGRNR